MPAVEDDTRQATVPPQVELSDHAKLAIETAAVMAVSDLVMELTKLVGIRIREAEQHVACLQHIATDEISKQIIKTGESK